MSRLTQRIEIHLAVELRLALGSAVGAITFLALAAAAILALGTGAAEIAQQHAEIDRARAASAASFGERMAQRPEPADAGLAAYEDFHLVADAPGPWAFIALGARDGAAPMQRIRMLGLEAQIYDSGLVHPDLTAAGAFDFSFVIIFLLPLALIAVLHDLRSGESDAGRLALLSSLVAAPRRFWLVRVAVRVGLALAAILAPLGIFVLTQGAPVAELPAILIAIVTYTLGWALLATCVALRPGATTTGSAIVLLVLWCLSVLVLPGLANAHALWAHRTGHGAEIVLAQRQQVNDAWDLPKESTFREFFKHYPEWRDTPPVTGRFHWKWYYAFHEVGDRSVAKQVARYDQALRDQERLVELWSLAVPAIALQRVLTATAETDASRRWAHTRAVRRFHAGLLNHLYPWIFDELPLEKRDLESLPTFEPAPSAVRAEPLAGAGLGAFLALAGLLTAVSSTAWRRQA